MQQFTSILIIRVLQVALPVPLKMMRLAASPALTHSIKRRLEGLMACFVAFRFRFPEDHCRHYVSSPPDYAVVNPEICTNTKIEIWITKYNLCRFLASVSWRWFGSRTPTFPRLFRLRLRLFLVTRRPFGFRTRLRFRFLSRWFRTTLITFGGRLIWNWFA